MLNGKNLCNPHAFMRHKKTPTNSVTHPGIMALKSGVVWVGCPDPECKNEIAIKKCSQHEFHTQKVLHSEFPSIVPKVFDGVECFDGFYMYSEYMNQGTLKQNKTKPNVDLLVYKTLLAIKKIHDKHPNFRHNDLHIDNVLVKGDDVRLYDFGFSNWYGNPIFDSKLKTDYGIYPGNHTMYDVHFFMNSISADLPARFKAKALSIFPKEYLMRNSKYVRDFRLRSDVTHKNLPTMNQVIEAFSMRNNNKKMRPKVLVFTGPEKKTIATRKISPSSPKVAFTLANRRKMSDRKAEIIRMERARLESIGVKNINNIVRNFELEAERRAAKNIKNLKLTGLINSPIPSPLINRKPKNKKVMKVDGPSRPVPVLTFGPNKRPRIDKKLCTSYKKDELINVMRRLGYRVDKKMTLKEMCGKLIPKTRAESVVAVSVYKRPTGNSIVNVRKQTYPSLLRKNLYTLSRAIKVPVLSKNKKGIIVDKIYAKLNKNYANIMKKSNKSKITTRQVAEKLAHEYGWLDDRHVERLRLVKTFRM